MHCGQPIGTPKPTQAPSGGTAVGAAYQQDARKKKTIAAVIGIFAAILGIFLGLKAAGVLGANTTKDPGTLQARGATSGPVLVKEAAPTPPVLEKGAEKKVMPKDVEDWLKHLEKCEAMKVEITLRQQAELMKFQQMLSVLGPDMNALNPYDNEDSQSPDKITGGKFADLRPDWEKLIQYFNSYPPPEECRPIADDFGRALSEIPGMTSDVIDVLNTVGQDPSAALQKVNKLKGKSYGDIDRYFNRADQRLKAICEKYDTSKWFNVKGDVIEGGSLGKF